MTILSLVSLLSPRARPLRATLGLTVASILSACAVTSPASNAALPLRVDAQPASPGLERALGSGSREFKPTPVPNLLQVNTDGQVLYVTRDAHYMIQGDLIDLSSGVDLTTAERSALALKQLAGLPAHAEIAFSPPASVAHRYTITVFSDIDCGYCRRFHSQIAEYNQEGIEVHYLAWPRTGPGSLSWEKAEGVWCAPYPRSAFTAAILKAPLQGAANPLPGEACADIVAADYALGQRLGVRGTPTLILPDGSTLPGYVPPQQLAQRLAALPARTPSGVEQATLPPAAIVAAPPGL